MSLPTSGPRGLHYASVPRGHIADVPRQDAAVRREHRVPPGPPPAAPMACSPQWWQTAQDDRRAPPAAAALPEEAPRHIKLRTLGILKKYNHPAMKFYEYRFLVWIKDCLTRN